MTETELLIGREGLDFQDDFYPEDLPSEWRFDYYSTLFRALSLPIDTDEDLDAICEELADSEEEFELIISFSEAQLFDDIQRDFWLKSLKNYQANFILFCETERTPDAHLMRVLAGYRLCFQSASMLALDLTEKSVAGRYLYFNSAAVFYAADNWQDAQIRPNLEQVATLKSRTVLICKKAEREALDSVRTIAEILGF